MVCNTPQELLAEIRKYMYINEIQDKDLAIRMKKSPQSISQIFAVGNPKLSTLFEICNALGLQVDVNLIKFINDRSHV